MYNIGRKKFYRHAVSPKGNPGECCSPGFFLRRAYLPPFIWISSHLQIRCDVITAAISRKKSMYIDMLFHPLSALGVTLRVKAP